MSDWHSRTLQEIISTIESGTRPKGGVRIGENSEGVPSYGGENISMNGGMLYDSVRMVPTSFATEMRRGVLSDKDVLINKDGANTGKSAIYRKPAGEKFATINEHLFLLRCNQGIAEQEFLYHFLNSEFGKSQIAKVITGSAQPGLNSTFPEFVRIDLPPLPEQKKIAEILSGIDKTIHIHQQKIEDLSTLLGEILREHYQERCENSDLQLEKVIRLPIQYGANASATKLQSGEPRYIRITDIKEDGALNELNAVGIDLPSNDWNNYLLREGDLLLARTGNTIGKSYLHKRTNEELVFAGYLLRVALDQEAYRPEYLFLFTQSDIYKDWISETSRTGAQPNINAKEYGAMPIPYSSISEQDAFIGRAMSLRRSKSILSNKVDKLKMLKQAISSDLLSGHKRVSV